MAHDVSEHVGYLRQILSDHQRPTGLLLGAGCPKAVETEDEKDLIPDLGALTSALTKELSNHDDSTVRNNWESLASYLEDTVGDDYDLEEILSRVRRLRQLADGVEICGLSENDLASLEKEITGSVVSAVNRELPGGRKNTPYDRLADWVGALERDRPVEIFTTNYDLLIEQGFERNQVPYFDGFIGSKDSFFDPSSVEGDDLPKRWARLWKLHGSINWVASSEEFAQRPPSMDGHSEQAVIHPSELKYSKSRRLPYLALMDRLRDFLSQKSSVLITCGYSFRDQHINDIILQGLQRNPSSTLFALSYSSLDTEEEQEDQKESDVPPIRQIATESARISALGPLGGVISRRYDRWDDIDKIEGNPEGVDGRLAVGDFGVLSDAMTSLVPRSPSEVETNE